MIKIVLHASDLEEAGVYVRFVRERNAQTRRNARALAHIDSLIQAVIDAGEVFAGNAVRHLTKGPKGYDKVQTNLALAQKMQKALEPLMEDEDA